MTSPDTPRARLYPEPDQLHSYIDRWESYIFDLENRLETELAAHSATRTTLSSEIANLKSRLEVVVEPYISQIAGLEETINAQSIRVRYLEGEQQEAIARLAAMLEVSSTAKGITLAGLISQAQLFIDETKKQFRESL